MMPFINRAVIAELQYNNAVNLKSPIFGFGNGTFTSLLRHLFIPGAAAVLGLFYLPLELPFFSAAVSTLIPH